MRPMKLALSAAIILASITANAQTADDIVNKHLDAMGGKDKLNGVTSMVIESSVNAMGSDNPSTTTFVAGVGYKNSMDMQQGQIVQTITPKGGWMINPFQGGTDAQPMPDDQFKGSEGQLYIDPFLDYAAHGAKVELQGKDGNNYKVVLTNKDNVATTYYIDGTTYYIVKAVRNVNMMGNDVELDITMSDQKKTDYGVVVPYTMEIAYGTMFSMTTTVKKVTINGPVDPKVFDMPGK